jgi:twitching motility two-component system response regulator PilG
VKQKPETGWVEPHAAPLHRKQENTVLVVDDSPTVRKIVAVTLERQGYRVLSASGAIEALARINEALPDLILLDIAMPHMDGYQLCKLIKGNTLTKSVPVVMLSGKDGFFDKVRGRMNGATHYITKPFEPATLVEAVQKYCRRNGAS